MPRLSEHPATHGMNRVRNRFPRRALLAVVDSGRPVPTHSGFAHPGTFADDESCSCALLKHGPHSKKEQKGSFSVSCMREFAILPDEAHSIVAQSREALKRFLVKNIEADESKMDPESVAEMVLVFFSGLCIERNLKSGKNSRARKIESLMKVLRSL
jgi:hypothetical protein